MALHSTSVYRWYMTSKSTTVKVSIATRDRIRSLGGETYEETIVAALDLLESERFWTQADAAAAQQRALSEASRARLAEREADVDRAFEGVE